MSKFYNAIQTNDEEKTVQAKANMMKFPVKKPKTLDQLAFSFLL